jgi:hypothetical protein
MATTGELRMIIQDLHLVDVGDAESYLGQEATEPVETMETVEAAMAMDMAIAIPPLIPAPALIEPVCVLVANDDQLATCA